MPIKAIQTILVVLGEQHFDHGYLCGRSWYFHGDTPEKPVTWEDVVRHRENQSRKAKVLASQLGVTHAEEKGTHGRVYPVF